MREKSEQKEERKWRHKGFMTEDVSQEEDRRRGSGAALLTLYITHISHIY